MGSKPKGPWLLDLHRWLGGLAVVFTVAHVGGLIADSYVSFDLVDALVPFAASWRPGAVAWGVLALWVMVAIEVTSLLMRRLPKRVWRAVHLSSYLLAVAATLARRHRRDRRRPSRCRRGRSWARSPARRSSSSTATWRPKKAARTIPARPAAKASAPPLEDAERAEAGRVEQRLGLADAAAGAHGCEVADRRPAPPRSAPTLGHELVDAVGAQPVGLATVGVGAGSWSTATSQVMSCVPRPSSGRPPRSWPRYVRTHSVQGRSASSAVVDA